MKGAEASPVRLDIAIMEGLQSGLEVEEEPFRDLANSLDITQEEILSRIKVLLETGVLRRFGASLSPSKLGLRANGMVVCKVPANRITRVGKSLSRLREVTHCYQRRTVPKIWDYNLYFMVHGPSRRPVEMFVASLMRRLQVKEYEILFSVKELKKTSTTLH
ncbi:Lrp/AsnC family transcriptional regulator [Candidatus Bathyarchaeota archaeon]|nr:Lrp/AsnC family transcriptional regulator [Candidatus Bathyarchaeota archaeon]